MNITEAALTESATLRKSYTDVSVLDRVGVVTTLPDDMHLTTEMVATFYGVPESTVKEHVQNNKDELVENGLRVVRGAELKQLKRDVSAGQGTETGNPSQLIGSRATSVTLFNRKTLLNVGMLLRDSEVAKQVRTYLLEVEASSSSDQRSEAISRMEKKVDRLTESLGDYFQIESEAKGLNMSATADILGVRFRFLVQLLLDEGWIHQPYQSTSIYLPSEWAVTADLVEFAPKSQKSSARVTANGRRVLRKVIDKRSAQ